DDYLTKPFNPLELTVRVKSLIRRAYYFSGANNEDKDVIKVGGGPGNVPAIIDESADIKMAVS
ncbi:hypothetical protein D1N53_23870, partial [Clostridioides difficile]